MNLGGTSSLESVSHFRKRDPLQFLEKWHTLPEKWLAVLQEVVWPVSLLLGPLGTIHVHFQKRAHLIAGADTRPDATQTQAFTLAHSLALTLAHSLAHSLTLALTHSLTPILAYKLAYTPTQSLAYTLRHAEIHADIHAEAHVSVYAEVHAGDVAGVHAEAHVDVYTEIHADVRAGDVAGVHVEAHAVRGYQKSIQLSGAYATRQTS
jgi:hypothetical protein